MHKEDKNTQLCELVTKLQIYCIEILCKATTLHICIKIAN